MASKSKTIIKGTLGAPIYGLSAALIIALASNTAFASLNTTLKERILRKAERVNRLAQTHVDELTNQEGRQLADLLTQAARILRDQDTNPTPGPNPNPNPLPNPGPFPPQPTNAYMVTAKLGSLDVSFDGYGLESLNQQCNAYLNSQGKVYQIAVNGKTMSDNWNGYTTQRTCAILTLNAQALSSFANTELVAKIGEIPVQVKVSDRIELQNAIATYIPQLTGGAKVYSYELNGKQYADNWNGFTTQALVAILKWNSTSGFGYFVSEGTYGNSPFIFTGNIGSEIEAQCLEYAREVLNGAKVYSFVVNGQRREDNWNGFTAAQACMTIKTLAIANH